MTQNQRIPSLRLLRLLSCLILGALCHTSIAQSQPDKLADQFAQPPEYAKPWTWWHWVSGNVSSEGITADLQAMKKIGLGGAQIFTVDQSDVKGPVKFMSPEWRALVHHAITEADRLHLVISMEGCDGWSESGGPWVPASESMQQVVWSERQVSGGAKVPLDLPQPKTVLGYYEDIALYAFPSLAPTAPLSSAKITASDPAFDPSRLLLSGTHRADISVKNPAEPQWLQLEYPAPVTFSSLHLECLGDWPHGAWEIQSGDDGAHFVTLASIQPGITAAFKTTTAKFFRLWRPNMTPKVDVIPITSLHFGGPLLDQLEARAGMRSLIDASNFVTLDLSQSDVIDPKSLVNLTGQHVWNAPAGDWTLIRIGHTSTGATTHPSTTPGLECDKLDPAAVSHHIQSMFGPVFADSSAAVGNTFKNILLDSWEAGCENWAPRMPAEFQKRRGYALAPWLPALTGKIIGSAELTQRFLWDYRRTLADLLAEFHYKVIQDFAHQHSMGLDAEAAGIGNPTVQDQLLCKKYTDIPMGEFWTRSAFDTDIDDTKEAASAAHIYGKPIAGAESFTATPINAAWKNDPYSLKPLGDLEFCLGINRFIFHRYAHQPWFDRLPGMSMGPWGINFERTNTWWEPGAAWISYLTRCEYLLQQGRFIADLCYFYGEGAPVCLHHNDLRPTPPRGYDYDVCDADVLLNSTTVDYGLISLAGGMQYRVLVLPPTDRMTLPVLRKIESLVAAGATVYGPRPLHSPSLPADQDAKLAKIADALWGPCDGKTVTEHAYGKGRIIWGEPLEKALAVSPDFKSDQGDLLYIHRKAGLDDIYFVSNQEPREITAQCTFRVAGKIPELWHPDTGAHETLALYHSAQDQTIVPLHFDPSGSAFVIFRTRAARPPAAPGLKLDGHDLWTANTPPVASLPAVDNGLLSFTAFQGGRYEFSNGSGTHIRTDIPILPPPLELPGPWQITFPPKLGAPDSATFDHLISWTDSPIDGVKYFSGTATYQKDFTLPPAFAGKNRRIYLDLGIVKNLAQLTLNGKDLGVLWKPPFRADITGALQPGNNHLEVKITNLWPNRLIGDQKIPEDKRITWASVSLYKADSPLLPSGLLGPVALIPAQQVSIIAPAL